MTGREDEPDRGARIDDRVLEMLSERASRIAFNGLRRTLGVHPESLTRALRRLERAGTVTRTEAGYARTEPALGGSEEAHPVRTVASVQLPPGAQAEDILGRLAGRWFGSLRWVGIHEHPGDPWLVWSTERGHAHFMLAIQRGSLRVLTDLAVRGAGTEDGAAYELLAQAVDRIRAVAPRSDSSVLTLEAGTRPAPRYAS